MPDSSGALTPADHDKIKAWFAAHWKDPVACPVCKTSQWTYGGFIVKAIRNAPDALQPGTAAFPYLPVSCNTCAHTMFFAVIPMGLYAAPPVQNALAGVLFPHNPLYPNNPPGPPNPLLGNR